MNTENELRYKEAYAAILDLFYDKSVSAETAKENLQALIEEIELLIYSLDSFPNKEDNQ